MVIDVELHKIGDGILNFLDSWIAKFNYLPAFLADQMIMLPALISLLKLGNVFAKLMFDYQIAFQQQFNCVI